MASTGKGNLVMYFCKGERAIIDDMNIVVTVVESDFGGCKLAFEADRSVRIDREKVYQKKKADGNY